MDRMQAVLSIVQEINGISIWLAQLGKDHSTLLQRKEQLLKLVSQISDMATAFFLHRCDYFADEDGGIRFEHMLGACQWGIWLNVNKNPRTKMIEFPNLNLNFEVQKQIALAPVAVRVQILPTIDEFNDVCTNELMAVGPVISVDMLVLPPTSKPTVRQWVIRFHGPLTNAISKIPYPIPPAGADPNTWTTDEDIAPLTVTADVTPKLVQLGQQELQVRTLLSSRIVDCSVLVHLKLPPDKAPILYQERQQVALGMVILGPVQRSTHTGGLLE